MRAVELTCALESRLGSVGSPAGDEGAAEMIMSFRAFGFAQDRALEKLYRRTGTATLMERDTQIMQGIWLIFIHVEDASIMDHGFTQVASLMQRQSTS